MLGKLLKSACIEENSVIIFDEPESHLHPKWQYVLAELVVLMKKINQCTILKNIYGYVKRDFEG